MLLLGVEKVRTGARQSFADTISGTDLIVGARSGSIQLLLYSVFRIGNATNNITWPSFQDIASRPEIAWVVPLSLGDSHRGFRVLGTTPDYFTHYKYRQTHGLHLRRGRAVRRSLRRGDRRRRGRDARLQGRRPHHRRRTGSAPSPSSSTTTSRSASRASWRRPARRSTARCT